MEKAKEFQKNIDFSFIDYAVVLTVWITTNWKILEEMGIPDHLTCMRVKKQQLEPDMKQQTGSKLEKEYKAVCTLSLCLFNLYTEYLMWNGRLDESQLEVRLLREISTTSDMQMIPL